MDGFDLYDETAEVDSSAAEADLIYISSRDFPQIPTIMELKHTNLMSDFDEFYSYLEALETPKPNPTETIHAVATPTGGSCTAGDSPEDGCTGTGTLDTGFTFPTPLNPDIGTDYVEFWEQWTPYGSYVGEDIIDVDDTDDHDCGVVLPNGDTISDEQLSNLGPELENYVRKLVAIATAYPNITVEIPFLDGTTQTISFQEIMNSLGGVNFVIADLPPTMPGGEAPRATWNTATRTISFDSDWIDPVEFSRSFLHEALHVWQETRLDEVEDTYWPYATSESLGPAVEMPWVESVAQYLDAILKPYIPAVEPDGCHDI